MNPWTITCQTPLSMGFPRQEYWSRLPFPSPGDCPDPEIESVSPAFSSIFFTTESPEKPMLEPRPYLLHYLHGLLDCRHCILFIFLFFFSEALLIVSSNIMWVLQWYVVYCFSHFYISKAQHNGRRQKLLKEDLFNKCLCLFAILFS